MTAFVGVAEYDTVVPTGQTRVITSEVWTGETLEEASKVWSCVEGLPCTVCGERMRVADLANAELLVYGLSLMQLGWREKERSAMGCATCATASMYRCLLGRMVRPPRVHLTRLRSGSIYYIYSCLDLENYIDVLPKIFFLLACHSFSAFMLL